MLDRLECQVTGQAEPSEILPRSLDGNILPLDEISIASLVKAVVEVVLKVVMKSALKASSSVFM